MFLPRVGPKAMLVFALAEFQVRLFAMEIVNLHLGAGQIPFEQVVFGLQIGVLQAQALFPCGDCWRRFPRPPG